MLRLIIGKAGAGKTGAIIEEIRQAVAAGRGGSMLLVPEQYSHEAERELCRVCGDALSLYGEVFSFTGLARRVLQQQGGAAPAAESGEAAVCQKLNRQKNQGEAAQQKARGVGGAGGVHHEL